MDKPTHRQISTGGHCYPEGYDPADLELLPADYWDDEDSIREASILKASIDVIKDKAGEDIDAVVPLWKQVEDLWAIVNAAALPVPADVAARRDEVLAIKDQSNVDEATLIQGEKHD